MAYFSSNHQPACPQVKFGGSNSWTWHLKTTTKASWKAFSKMEGPMEVVENLEISHVCILEMMNWKKTHITGVVTFMECIYPDWLAASSNFKIELPTISPTQKIETCFLVVPPFAAHFISKECCLFWSEIPNCKTFGKAVLPGRHWPVHTPVEEDDGGWLDRHSIGPFQNPNNKG